MILIVHMKGYANRPNKLKHTAETSFPCSPSGFPRTLSAAREDSEGFDSSPSSSVSFLLAGSPKRSSLNGALDSKSTQKVGFILSTSTPIAEEIRSEGPCGLSPIHRLGFWPVFDCLIPIDRSRVLRAKTLSFLRVSSESETVEFITMKDLNTSISLGPWLG